MSRGGAYSPIRTLGLQSRRYCARIKTRIYLTAALLTATATLTACSSNDSDSDAASAHESTTASVTPADDTAKDKQDKAPAASKDVTITKSGVEDHPVWGPGAYVFTTRSPTTPTATSSARPASPRTSSGPGRRRRATSHPWMRRSRTGSRRISGACVCPRSTAPDQGDTAARGLDEAWATAPAAIAFNVRRRTGWQVKPEALVNLK